jgi:agmatine deiminase
MRMPAEWEKHSRTWVAFPHTGYTLGETEDEIKAAYKTWSNVANQASDFEPVSVVVHPADFKVAQQYLSKEIELVEIEIDDAWIRDSGPTFAFDGNELVAMAGAPRAGPNLIKMPSWQPESLNTWGFEELAQS